MNDHPSGPVEVLFVVDDDVLDRFGCVLRHLCVGMMDEPVRTTILSRSARAIEDSMGPARVIRLPRLFWPWQRWSAEAILEEFEMSAPDVVHCFSARLLDWAGDWAREWGSRCVVHLTDRADAQQLAANDALAGVTAVCTTASVERDLLEANPAMRDRTHVIPVGVPAASEPSCLADPDRVPAAIVAAPLTHESGVDRVIRALQTVVRSGQEAHLFLIADGPAERSLRRLVEQLELLHHVTFAGPMRDWSMIEDALRGADFYIMPGVRRRFTALRLIAMATGLGILAPTGTSEDYLIEGTTARLFDPQDEHQLTQTWLAMLDDRTNARRLGETALDYARAHHQASTMATAIAWLYQEMLQSSVGTV